MLQIASQGLNPKIIVSSGPRSVVEAEDDVGIMALRTPADLINLIQVIMKLDSRTSFEAVHMAGNYVLEQAHIRRFGKQSIRITGITVKENGLDEENVNPTNEAEKSLPDLPVRKRMEDNSKPAPRKENVNKDDEEDDDGEDGFIAF